MFSVFIGYILELDERTKSVLIETSNGNTRISEELFNFRQQLDFHEENIPEDDLTTWNELQQKGVLFFTETMDELYDSIKSTYPSRQGVIFKSEKYSCIVLGELPIEIVKLQSFIWKSADGKRNLGEVFNKAKSKNFLNDTNLVHDFVENVIGLVRAGILTLK